MTEILEELRGKNADDLDDSKTPEELRGKTPDELQQFVEVLDAHLRSIHQDEQGELREKTDAEQSAFDYGLKLRDKAIKRIDENRAIQEVFRRRPKAVEQAMFHLAYGRTDAYRAVRGLANHEARDQALRVLEGDRTSPMTDAQRTQVDRSVRRDTDIARRIIVTENDDYRNAWMKMVTDPQAAAFLTDDERNAMRAWNEY